MKIYYIFERASFRLLHSSIVNTSHLKSITAKYENFVLEFSSHFGFRNISLKLRSRVVGHLVYTEKREIYLTCVWYTHIGTYIGLFLSSLASLTIFHAAAS